MNYNNQYKFITDYKPLVDSIRAHAKAYLSQSGRASVVLGVSGGIDSALVAALIRPVCDELDIKLYGRSLPASTNKLDELHRAENVGDVFCHNFEVTSIQTAYDDLNAELYISIEGTSSDSLLYQETEQERNIRRGNIKARLRMINLFNLAQLSKGLVLSTDNLTELLLGFWTLHGDVGNFGMIQYLWKTEVYGLSEFLCNTELKDTIAEDVLRACIDCHATDGLGVSKSDLDQIMPDWEERHKTTRSGYEEVDEVLKLYLQTGATSFAHEGIIARHKRTEFKRNDPYCITREQLIPTVTPIEELMFDWNKLNMDQMAEHLREKFMFSSSGDAKCIAHLLEFYDKHK